MRGERQIAIGANSQNPGFARSRSKAPARTSTRPGQQITRKNLNIQPTIEVPPGRALEYLRDQGLDPAALDGMISKKRNPLMKKATLANLPPIAVEERPEKLALSIPLDLKYSLEQFAAILQRCLRSNADLL